MQFTLANAATLQGLVFFGAADVSNVPSQFGGTIGFRFLSNNAGAPGTSLALGSDSSVQLVNNGTQNVGTDEYRFLVNLGSIPLGAGTYWLAMHEGAMGTAADGTSIYWDTTSSAPLVRPLERPPPSLMVCLAMPIRAPTAHSPSNSSMPPPTTPFPSPPPGSSCLGAVQQLDPNLCGM